MFKKPLTRGFTLFEILVVLAIVAIVAALLYPVFSSAKTASKQTHTSARLQQIYRSMLLYGGDYQVSDEVPGLGNVPAMPLIRSNLLFAYGLEPIQLHSAAFPVEGQKRWGSSFTWYWVTRFVEPDTQKEVVRNRELLSKEQGQYVIVSDIVHDYFEYWPSEKLQDALMQRRFEINLRVNGSVKRERRPGIRGTVLPYWWKP